ncbi:hypothetical protein FAES_3196 [Fibrella aestuarina BUZ 2]|uniref:Uncharacterized protein n=1 Tax=Fibrella aestuarina BUZ 2 TaxID=1166018 RepID=I0KAQ2_9BACT|nr:hypothetical protein FAES_3196 [Fibrella aestuarina BUZ 2]
MVATYAWVLSKRLDNPLARKKGLPAARIRLLFFCVCQRKAMRLAPFRLIFANIYTCSQ